LRLKPLNEVIERIKEGIHRYRRRYLKKNLRPCPNNCKMAEIYGQKVVGCTGCGSRNPELCAKEKLFQPLYTKDELYEQFKAGLRNPAILQREYRDLVALFWVIGAFDTQSVDEQVINGVEKRVEKLEPGNSSAVPDPAFVSSPSQSGTGQSDQPATTTHPRIISRQRGVGKV